MKDVILTNPYYRNAIVEPRSGTATQK